MSEDKMREMIDQLIDYAEATGRNQFAQVLRCAAVAAADEYIAACMTNAIAPLMIYMKQLQTERNN